MWSMLSFFEMTLGPVHIMSMPGSKREPIVFKYSDWSTVGTARLEQYSETKVDYFKQFKFAITD